jgi:ribose/xylose/arabinose/galactoside ABC-type transport system permease subunit
LTARPSAAAAYANWHVPLFVGVVIGVLIGTLVGAINGLVITRLGVSSFIATLGSAAVITAPAEVGQLRRDAPGTCIVQRGTRHAWHNRSDKAALMMHVLVGANREG